jgi:hypothetical protein
MTCAARHPGRRGFTLVEAMLLVVILGIVSLGFGIGMQANTRVPAAVDFRLAVHTRLVEKMEDLAALDFATLAANTGLSDSVTVNGQTLARTVTATPIDADGVNGVDSDFLEVAVTLNGQTLKTRVAKP